MLSLASSVEVEETKILLLVSNSSMNTQSESRMQKGMSQGKNKEVSCDHSS